MVPPPHIQPYPKAGLAVAGAAVISPIEIVDVATSPLVVPLARALVRSVYDEETKLVKNYVRAEVGWLHPYSDDERKETPFRIDAMYKVARGLDGRDVYYYEGLKHYAVRDPASKSSKTSSSKTPPVGDVDTRVARCDGYGRRSRVGPGKTQRLPRHSYTF